MRTSIVSIELLRILTMTLLFCEVTYAAIDQKVKHTPGQWLQTNGDLHGGVSGNGFSLLGLQQIQDKKLNIERLIFDVGDFNGQPLKRRPGYYHVELRGNRLLVDFSQMVSGNLTEKELIAKLKKSPHIKSASMTVDPEDKNLNITLQLREKPKVRVFQVEGVKTTSKVVIDLTTQQ